MARRGRAGRLQRADRGRRAGLARGDDGARRRALSAPSRDPVQRPLHGGDAARARGRGGEAVGAVPRAVRSGRGPFSCRGRRARDRGGDRRRRQPRPGPDPARVPVGRARDAAHELFPARAEAVRVVQARPDADPDLPAAAAAVRDLRALAAGRGRAPARRVGRPRRPALVGPARGLPHRDPRPDEGADGQERADRAGRGEGWVRDEARRRPGRRVLHAVHQRAAGHHRHDLGRRGRAAGARGPPRRRRPVSGRGRRQGHGDVQRHRQRGRRAVRLLAGRRLCEWRLGRLRPQGDGDHGEERLGVRPASLPRARRRRPGRGLHRRRRRRHERRRVRQRDAALAAHPAGRRVRSPPRVPRSEPGRGVLGRRAAAAVRPPALLVGRLRPRADLRRRRDLPAHGEVDRADRAGA